MNLKDDLLNKMRELGLAPKRSLGQNFLISDHVVSEIFSQIDRREPPFIVEVGPGLGALTESILERHIPHILIELDRKFADYWRGRGENVMEVDALQVDWLHLNIPEGSLLLSNLPYQIGGRLVIELSKASKNIDVMILMFQKEVAERLVASPSTKDYGFLTVIAQTFWQIGRVVDAKSADFLPAPNVDSRVMSFKRRKLEMALGEEYIAFVKQAFSHRRKYMIKSFQEGQDKIKSALEKKNYALSVRAEEISPQDFLAIYLDAKEFKGGD